MTRWCHAHQMKGLGTLICLATKILKIGQKLTSMRGSGYLDCQSHNSLNFGPIFKILVAKHISGPRPFIWCAEHPRGTWPRASKRVLKLVHENQKLCFFDENQLLGVFPQTFFNGSPQRCTQSLSLKFGVIRTKTKKVMWVKSWNYWRLLVTSIDLWGQSTLWGWNRLVLGFPKWYGTWYLVQKCGL